MGALPLLQFVRRVHTAATALAAAVAQGSVVFVAIVKPIIVGEFFAGGDVAQRLYKDPVLFLVGLTVGIAGVVHEHGHPMPIDHNLAVTDPKEIGERAAIVANVSLSFADAFARVLENTSFLRDVVQGEASSGVNIRGTNNQAWQAAVLPESVVSSITYDSARFCTTAR